MAFDLDAPPKSLLTFGNPKVAKGSKQWLAAAIPARMQPKDAAPHA
jgi:hypothetical protein